MSKKTIAKYSWLIYLIVILVFFFVNYADYKAHEGITHISGDDVATAEVTPIADLVCIECHSDLDHTQGNGLDLPGNEWFDSTHKDAGTTCVECHGGVSDNSSDPMSGSFIGKPARNDIPEICGKCHVEVYDIYDLSIHSGYVFNNETGINERASVCTDCHGIHHIETSQNPESPTYIANSPDTCSKCHEALYYSYEDSYHGIFLKYGNTMVAACPDCHTNHNIRPQTDPESSIHPDNLPETCIECHPSELDVKVALGYQHFEEDSGSPVLKFDKEDLEPQEAGYYIGPVDTRFWVPFMFNMITMVIIPSIIIMMILENVGPGLTRRISGWKKKSKK